MLKKTEPIHSPDLLVSRLPVKQTSCIAFQRFPGDFEQRQDAGSPTQAFGDDKHS